MSNTFKIGDVLVRKAGRNFKTKKVVVFIDAKGIYLADTKYNSLTSTLEADTTFKLTLVSSERLQEYTRSTALSLKEGTMGSHHNPNITQDQFTNFINMAIAKIKRGDFYSLTCN